MRIDRRSFWAAAAVLGLLASLGWENRAQAQVTESLYLGGGFPSFYYSLSGPEGTGGVVDGGSGSIANASLGGVPLAYVYCIDIPDSVTAANSTYANNTVTTNGTAVYGMPLANTWANGTQLVSVPHAAQIAYLLDTYGASATTATEQEALQSAIWTEIYGPSNFQVYNPGGFQQDIVDQMNIYLHNVGTAPVSDALWLSPQGVGNQPIQQALVAQYVTPEPSTFAIAGLGALAFVGYGLRRRKARGA